MKFRTMGVTFKVLDFALTALVGGGGGIHNYVKKVLEVTLTTFAKARLTAPSRSKIIVGGGGKIH